MGYVNLKINPEDPLIVGYRNRRGDFILDPRKISIICPESQVRISLETNNDIGYLRYRALCNQIDRLKREDRCHLVGLKKIVDEKLNGLEGM